MDIKFVRCESIGCKNLTSDLYKNLYGAYCFEHCAKTHKPEGVLDKPKLISPISPRRTKTLESSKVKSSQVEFENYEFKPISVPSAKFTPISPRRSAHAKDFYVRKTECCICKNPYDETKTMKCGHLICPECLEGRVRKPYCDFCDEPLEGPLITSEVLSKIEDKYKQDQEEEFFDFPKESDSDEESSSDEESDSDEESSSDEEEVLEKHNEIGL